MIFDGHANLKYKYGNRKFWCKGYYFETVGKNKKVIEEYIRNQLQDQGRPDKHERINRPIYREEE